VTLVILNACRPEFVKLALHQIGLQDYPLTSIEAIVVDDGDVSFRTANRTVFTTRILRSEHKMTVGAKRNLAYRAASGDIIMSWDDDDLHHPHHITALACRIFHGDTEVVALAYTHLATLSSEAAVFYQYGRTHKRAFLGTLAFSRGTAEQVLGRLGSPLFPNTSLAEDLWFVERALKTCHRFMVLDEPPIVYTRHLGVNNTYRASFQAAFKPKRAQAPDFVTTALVRAFVDAEHAAHQWQLAPSTSCTVLERHAPLGLARAAGHGHAQAQHCCSSERPSRMCSQPCVHACSLHWDCRGINTSCKA